MGNGLIWDITHSADAPIAAEEEAAAAAWNHIYVEGSVIDVCISTKHFFIVSIKWTGEKINGEWNEIEIMKQTFDWCAPCLFIVINSYELETSCSITQNINKLYWTGAATPGTNLKLGHLLAKMLLFFSRNFFPKWHSIHLYKIMMIKQTKIQRIISFERKYIEKQKMHALTVLRPLCIK